MKLAGAIVQLLRGPSAAGAVAGIAATSAVVLCLNVLTGVLTARLLGAAGRGELAVLLLWPQFLAQVFVFALPSAVIYHVRHDPGARAAIAGRALLLSLLGGVIAGLVGVIAMPSLLPNAERELLQRAQWMMAFAPIGTLSTVLTALVQLQERFHFYNFVRYAPLVLTLLALLMLHWLGRLTPLTGALAYYLPGIPAYGLMLVSVLRSVRPTLRGGHHTRQLLSYGARAYGGEAAGTLMSYIDKIVLVNMLSLSAYGVYVVVFNLSRIIVTLGASIVPVLLPRTAGRPANDVFRSTERALDVATPLLLLAALGFAACGGFALHLLYGAEFAGEHLALALLSFEAVACSIVVVLTQSFLALNRPGLITLVQIASVFVIIPALWLLSPLGVVGAALALLLTALLRTAGTCLAFRVFPDVRRPRIVPDVTRSLDWFRRLREAA